MPWQAWSLARASRRVGKANGSAMPSTGATLPHHRTDITARSCHARLGSQQRRGPPSRRTSGVRSRRPPSWGWTRLRNLRGNVGRPVGRKGRATRLAARSSPSRPFPPRAASRAVQDPPQVVMLPDRAAAATARLEGDPDPTRRSRGSRWRRSAQPPIGPRTTSCKRGPGRW
jgi:hypothetical protein